jgi:hypothetical protein
MFEVAEGVLYMHSEGVVHGDLKGVRIFILQIVNQFISSARTTSSLTLISTAELFLTWNRHDILILLLQGARHSHHILLRSCLEIVPNVAVPIALKVFRVMEHRERRRWRRTYTLSAASIIQ